MASTRSWSPRCPFCGFKTRTVHDSRRRKIGKLPVRRRCRSSRGNCGERHLETRPKFEGGLTRRLGCQLITSWSTMVAEHRRARRCWWMRPRCTNGTASSPSSKTATPAKSSPWCNTATPKPPKGSSSSRARSGAAASRLSSRTDRSPTRPSSRPTSAQRVTYSTGSISRPGSLTRSSTHLRDSTPGGTLCKNSTASTSPTAETVPCKRWIASPISTPPENSRSSTPSSTRSSRGATRYWAGTTPARPPTAESKAPTTSSRSSEKAPSASPTPTT